MDQIKEEKTKVVDRFTAHLQKVCYLEEWEEPRVNLFKVDL